MGIVGVEWCSDCRFPKVERIRYGRLLWIFGVGFGFVWFGVMFLFKVDMGGLLQRCR